MKKHPFDSGKKVLCEKCSTENPLFIFHPGGSGAVAFNVLAKTYDCKNCGDSNTVLFRKKKENTEWIAFEGLSPKKNTYDSSEIVLVDRKIPEWLSSAF